MLICANLRHGKTFLANSIRPILGGLLVAVVLLLNALAASPTLHEWFHADAGQSEHQCAVTLFAHGHMDSATVEVATVTPVVLVEATPLSVFFAFAPAIENLPAGRAPPVSVSSPV